MALIEYTSKGEWRQQSTICCDGLVLLVSTIHTLLWFTKPCVSSVGACHIPFWHSVRFFHICDDKLLLLAHTDTDTLSNTSLPSDERGDKKHCKAKCDLPCSFVVLFFK